MHYIISLWSFFKGYREHFNNFWVQSAQNIVFGASVLVGKMMADGEIIAPPGKKVHFIPFYVSIFT